MDIKNNFKKGSVEMILLSLLSTQDLYGYEMAQLIVEYGNGYITVPEGSLYPTLYRLEDRHYISSYKKLVGKRMKRIYYHIEDEGRDYLEELIKEYYAVNNCITDIIQHALRKDVTDEQ